MTGTVQARRAAQLFDAHARDLLGYLTRRTDRDTAEDLLSETFVALLREDRTFDDDRGGARAWLFGVATNLARHHHRSRLRAEVREATTTVGPEAAPDPAIAGPGHVDAERAARRLATALQALPDGDLDVLLLVAWGGLTPSEAAEALGIPTGTARSRLARVRSHLRTTAPTAPDGPPDGTGPTTSTVRTPR